VGFNNHRSSKKKGSKEAEWQCSKSHLKMFFKAKMSSDIFGLKKKRGKACNVLIVKKVIHCTVREFSHFYGNTI